MKVKKYYGSALKVSLLNKIIENTKIKNAADEIHDGNNTYYLDKDLSTRLIRIYYNPDKKHVVISHSSTIANTDEIKQSIKDIKDDIVLIFLGAKNTQRYKESIKTQVLAEQKYSNLDYSITNVGYSLGAQISANLSEREGSKTDEAIVYNFPLIPYDIIKGEKQKDNTYVVSTSNDATSILRPFSKDHDNNIVFDSNTYNPISAHYNNQLNLLDQDRIIGDTNVGMGIQNMKNLKKLKVKEIKQLIKKHRKGKSQQYQITKKSKQELLIMLEELLNE